MCGVEVKGHSSRPLPSGRGKRQAESVRRLGAPDSRYRSLLPLCSLSSRAAAQRGVKYSGAVARARDIFLYSRVQVYRGRC